MNSPASAAPRRSYRKWIIAGLVVFVAPLFVVAAVAWSMLTLDRDAGLLRREMMAATGSDWHTKVQLDVGSVTLGTARTVLRFVNHEHVDDARLALSAVRFASVGVYERDDTGGDADTHRIFTRTDEKMRARGWTRLVGVADGNQHVVIYTADHDNGDRMNVCLAVVDGRELVVASTQIDAKAMMQLVEKHAPADLKSKLKLAKVNF